MGTNLSKDSGVALLINAFSTIFALALLILIIAPISSAHFNPSVLPFIIAQLFGAMLGVVLVKGVNRA